MTDTLATPVGEDADASTPAAAPEEPAGKVATVEEPAPESAVELEGTPSPRPPVETTPSWTFATPAETAAAPTAYRVARPPLLHRTGPRRIVPVLAAHVLLTLDVTGMWWLARVNREVRDFDPRMSAHPRRTLVAAALPWFATIVAAVVGLASLLHDRLPQSLARVDLPREVALGMLAAPLVAGIAMLLVPFSCVAVVMTAERIRQAQEHAGITADVQLRPVRRALLLVLPVVGVACYAAALQAQLNRVWDEVEPPGR